MKKSFTKKDIKENIALMVECFPQLNEGLNMLRKTTEKLAENYEKLAFPYHPNWSYCIPIVPNYTLMNGTVVDIGIYVSPRMAKELGTYYCISANFVTSNDGPDYISGHISPTCESSKACLLMLRHMDIIDDAYIMDLIGKHNGLLDMFMHSELTVWELHAFIKKHGRTYMPVTK